MTLAQFLAFNLTLLAAMLSPGPAFLFALRQSVTGGFRTGVVTGLGLGLMAATWTGAALLGLHLVFVVVPWAYVVLKIGGALYLLYLAVSLWRNAATPLSEDVPAGRRAFLGGLLVNLANPKSVLFAASVLIVIFPKELTTASKALIVLDQFLVEALVYALFAGLLSSAPARAGYLRLKAVFDRLAGAVLGALGLRLLLDR